MSIHTRAMSFAMQTVIRTQVLCSKCHANCRWQLRHAVTRGDSHSHCESQCCFGAGRMIPTHDSRSLRASRPPCLWCRGWCYGSSMQAGHHGTMNRAFMAEASLATVGSEVANSAGACLGILNLSSRHVAAASCTAGKIFIVIRQLGSKSSRHSNLNLYTRGAILHRSLDYWILYKTRKIGDLPLTGINTGRRHPPS